MKKILIPIDFKRSSYDAIDYAVKFFKKEECQFFFLNAYTYDVNGFNAIHLLQANDNIFEKPRHTSEISLGQAVNKYIHNNSNEKHRFNAISECSSLVDAIKKTIKEVEIDLVVLPRKDNANKSMERYSKNTRNIIDNIRECPVLIIPSSAKMHENPKFVLASYFGLDVPKAELENWYSLIKIANGSIKIVTLSSKEGLSELQKANQSKVCSHLEMHFKKPIKIEYIENAAALKKFAKHHSDYIICLMDRKPDFWRKLGITHSRITDLGPLPSTPVIALHR